jgi:hypothetical protein
MIHPLAWDAPMRVLIIERMGAGMSVSGYPSFRHPSTHRPAASRPFRRFRRLYRWRRLLVLLVAGLLALIAALILEIRVLPAVSVNASDATSTANDVKRAITCAVALFAPGPDPGCRGGPLLPR